MAKIKRVQRPKGELKQELIDQIGLLKHSCEAYDSGLEACGKYIALTLRILLHHQGQSRSLLDQLGLRKGRFFDSAGSLNPGNLLSECNLVVSRETIGASIDDVNGRYVPQIATTSGLEFKRKMLFVDWWNNPVMKDKAGHTFSRMELVQHVADTDGGAHVDPDLDEAYMAISRENSIGMLYGVNGGSLTGFGGCAELACMRQIAHELLSTINLVPEFSDYAKPVFSENQP